MYVFKETDVYETWGKNICHRLQIAIGTPHHERFFLISPFSNLSFSQLHPSAKAKISQSVFVQTKNTGKGLEYFTENANFALERQTSSGSAEQKVKHHNKYHNGKEIHLYRSRLCP